MPASTPGQGSLFKIRYGSQAAYDGLATKDANTVYFLTDTGKIAVGDTYYNDSSFMYIGHRNTISAITSNDRKEGNVVSVGDAEQLYRYNGTDWVALNAFSDNLNSANNDKAPTVEAVNTELNKVFYRDHVTPMIVAIDANGHRVMNVPDMLSSADGRDAANKNYVDANTSDKVKLDGSTMMTGNLDVGNHKIINLDNPSTGTDAANKQYVDSAITGVSGVQSDWDETDPDEVSYIKNKPLLSNVATSGDYNDLSNKPSIPAAQVQSDWEESDPTEVSYIQNKPTGLFSQGELGQTNLNSLPNVFGIWTQSDESLIPTPPDSLNYPSSSSGYLIQYVFESTTPGEFRKLQKYVTDGYAATPTGGSVNTGNVNVYVRAFNGNKWSSWESVSATAVLYDGWY